MNSRVNPLIALIALFSIAFPNTRADICQPTENVRVRLRETSDGGNQLRVTFIRLPHAMTNAQFNFAGDDRLYREYVLGPTRTYTREALTGEGPSTLDVFNSLYSWMERGLEAGFSGGIVAVGGIHVVTGAAITVGAAGLAVVPGYAAGVASRRLWEAHRAVNAFQWLRSSMSQTGTYVPFQCATSIEAEPNDTYEQARWLQLALATLR